MGSRLRETLSKRSPDGRAAASAGSRRRCRSASSIPGASFATAASRMMLVAYLTIWSVLLLALTSSSSQKATWKRKKADYLCEWPPANISPSAALRARDAPKWHQPATKK